MYATKMQLQVDFYDCSTTESNCIEHLQDCSKKIER
jgi:hypothetical protein